LPEQPVALPACDAYRLEYETAFFLG